MSRSTFDAVRSAMQGLNDNREAKQAAAELEGDQRLKTAELAAIGRGMHEPRRTLNGSGCFRINLQTSLQRLPIVAS